MTGSFFAQRLIYGTSLTLAIIAFVLGLVVAAWYLAHTGSSALATAVAP